MDDESSVSSDGASGTLFGVGSEVSYYAGLTVNFGCRSRGMLERRGGGRG